MKVVKEKKKDVVLHYKKREYSEVLEKFDEFVNEEIPEEVNAYEWKDGEYLIKVFTYRDDRKKDKFEINPQNNAAYTNNLRHFSIAKVLAAHKEGEYKQGDLVKLRDTDTLTIESAGYKKWADNKYNKGNLKKVGQEPPRYLSNIYKSMGQYRFILNPLNIVDLDMNDEDEGIYKIPSNRIENKIKDVDLLLGK